MIEIVPHEATEWDEETRSGVSDRELQVLQYIQQSANEPIPMNQMALRTYYYNKIQALIAAHQTIAEEIENLFYVSYRKGVYDDRNAEFVRHMLGQFEGGKRVRKTRKSRIIKK